MNTLRKSEKRQQVIFMSHFLHRCHWSTTTAAAGRIQLKGPYAARMSDTKSRHEVQETEYILLPQVTTSTKHRENQKPS